MFKNALRATVTLLLTAAAFVVSADPRDLAPGFSGLPKDAKVVIAPLDVELFSITGGGVFEPRADWTDAAQHHLGAALHAKVVALGLGHNDLDQAKADELAELLNLHAAVARSIALHHAGPVKLPTKEGRLDWSFGDALKPLQDASGARYALFTWVRDSYASAERVAMMVGLALLGVGVGGGAQVGYASLVDLESGRVLWFNQLRRVSGDLREAAKATESVEALLAGFPAIR